MLGSTVGGVAVPEDGFAVNFGERGANSRSTQPLSTVAGGEAIYASLLVCYEP